MDFFDRELQEILEDFLKTRDKKATIERIKLLSLASPWTTFPTEIGSWMIPHASAWGHDFENTTEMLFGMSGTGKTSDISTLNQENKEIFSLLPDTRESLTNFSRVILHEFQESLPQESFDVSRWSSEPRLNTVLGHGPDPGSFTGNLNACSFIPDEESALVVYLMPCIDSRNEDWRWTPAEDLKKQLFQLQNQSSQPLTASITLTEKGVTRDDVSEFTEWTLDRDDQISPALKRLLVHAMVTKTPLQVLLNVTELKLPWSGRLQVEQVAPLIFKLI